LITITSCCTAGFKNFTKTFYLVQEAFASALAIIRIQIIFIISSLLQMIRHHYGIFQ